MRWDVVSLFLFVGAENSAVTTEPQPILLLQLWQKKLLGALNELRKINFNQVGVLGWCRVFPNEYHGFEKSVKQILI